MFQWIVHHKKTIFVLLLIWMFMLPFYQQLHQEKTNNAVVKEFCKPSYVGKTFADISLIIRQHKQLKIYKNPDQVDASVTKISILPQKLSIDNAICIVQIHENK